MLIRIGEIYISILDIFAFLFCVICLIAFVYNFNKMFIVMKNDKENLKFWRRMIPKALCITIVFILQIILSKFAVSIGENEMIKYYNSQVALKGEIFELESPKLKEEKMKKK